ncbi:hypothetical protein BKA62DRAFT_470583 [Auriculariales sp. MPI-PUGE-AT-0066]|nr:hypothetical protein BKA62DRAFT_470583 [Auriculariales sp. MPI-PUGE-AT-0066]
MSTASFKQRNHLLEAYLRNLAARPLATKAATAAVLQFTQDALASYLAGTRPKPSKAAPPHIKALATVSADMTSVRMALAGALVFGPLNHALGLFVTKLLAARGTTGGRAKLEAILAHNLIAAPINTAAYLASVAVVNGARTSNAILALVQRGFFSMLRATWVVSPTSMVIASKTLPPELWPIFFNFVGFVLGTLAAVRVKKAQLAAARKGKGVAPPKDDSAPTSS